MTEATRNPRLTIGLPVYNGERYLRASIDSILAQTFTDFELILSDNASTDSTTEICRAYAERDPRVVFRRQERNRGGFWNHYHVIDLARGELFMWAAHDDIREPDYVRACVEVLDARPEVVLCYCGTVNIDEEGRELAMSEVQLPVDSPSASERFRALSRMDYRLEPIYGVMRLDVLRQTSLRGEYADSDRVLLAELGLRGPFHRIPRVLFRRRDHAQGSIRKHATRQERSAWIHPDRSPVLVFPYFRQLLEYLRAIRRSAPSRAEALRCYGHMARWIARHARLLVWDLEYALRTLLGPFVRSIRALLS